MSEFNIEWAKQVFNNECVIFDIGCADLHDTLKFRQAFPEATIFAFECENDWKERNFIVSKETNINYFHVAVSDVDGIVDFYPTDTFDNQKWRWSGSIMKPGNELYNERWTWGKSYEVGAISLNTICKTHNIKPDLIHIDAQGAEYSIFKNIDKENCPSVIWAEVSEFHRYETGVTYEEFCLMLNGYGYEERFKNAHDSLFILKDFKTINYF